MGKTGTVKHTHQYFRRPDGLWACSGIDGCTHYMPSNMAPMPVGRMSLCWQCNGEFQLMPENMKGARPFCDDCREALERMDAILETKLKPVTGLATFGMKRKKTLTEVIEEPEVDQIENEYIPSDEEKSNE